MPRKKDVAAGKMGVRLYCFLSGELLGREKKKYVKELKTYGIGS